MHLKRLCSAALAVASVAALAPQASALAGVSGWALGEVGKAEAAGLAPAAFGSLPAKESITRAEFCAVSLRLFESSTGRVAELTGDRPFTDTGDPQVAAASALGLVSGRGDGTFDPDASVTRQELCVMLGNVMRTAGAGGMSGAAAPLQYQDADEVAPWAAADMANMVRRGVISGVVQGDGSVTLSPGASSRSWWRSVSWKRRIWGLRPPPIRPVRSSRRRHSLPAATLRARRTSRKARKRRPWTQRVHIPAPKSRTRTSR